MCLRRRRRVAWCVREPVAYITIALQCGVTLAKEQGMIKPEAKHVAFRDDLVAVLRKHGRTLTAAEILALAAHLVGQLVALQNQNTMTPERAMKIVAANIEQGNKEVTDDLLRNKVGD